MLMHELVTYISSTGMTQSQAARHCGVTQPRISDLTRGKIDLFSIDTLVNMLTAAGLQLDLHIRAGQLISRLRRGVGSTEVTSGTCLLKSLTAVTDVVRFRADHPASVERRSVCGVRALRHR